MIVTPGSGRTCESQHLFSIGTGPHDCFSNFSGVLVGIEPPAKTVLLVAGLAHPHYLIEIDAVAFMGDDDQIETQ